MSILTDFLKKKYGAETSTNENPIVGGESIGTTPERVLRRNPNRIGWTIINLSANTVYLAFNGNVSATRGILLDPSGGLAGSWIEEDGELTQKEVWLVASGAGSAVYVIETEVY